MPGHGLADLQRAYASRSTDLTASRKTQQAGKTGSWIESETSASGRSARILRLDLERRRRMQSEFYRPNTDFSMCART